jgi:uncharacterized RmlC-like cupin family protein
VNWAKYLASGKTVSMRLWQDEPPNEAKEPTQRDYETVGYVVQGRAELHLEGQMVLLEPGDSWVVPKGASHTYKIWNLSQRLRQPVHRLKFTDATTLELSYPLWDLLVIGFYSDFKLSATQGFVGAR